MIGNHKKACSRPFGMKNLDCLEIDIYVFKPIGPARVKQGTPEGKIDKHLWN